MSRSVVGSRGPAAFAGLVLLAGLGLAPAAHAWEPIDSSRPTWSTAVPYTLHSAGSADLGGFSATEPEVRRGMDDWARVSCTSLTTSYGGSASSLPVSGDGRSGIGWLESGWPHDTNAIGVTGPRWFRSIAEADMQMNGVNFTWSTGSGRGSTVNTYSIVLHEGGHYYGLGHSSDRGATMYFAYSGGIASLNADDQNGICALYPGSGTDCTTTGCPSGFECSGGACVRVMGDGGTCSPCTSGSDCSNGVCLGYPDGNGYCGTSCATAADCGGDVCVAISGAGNQCVRVRGSTPDCSGASGCRSDSDCSATERCNTSTGACVARPAGGAIGAPCGEASECGSGVCFAGRCSQSCNWLEPASCPGGFYCNGQVSGMCGAGLCLAGSPGGGALGDPCAAPTDCQTLFCAEGICSTPCIPDGATSCPEGFSCQTGELAGCGSCQQAGALGDACLTNEDCSSRQCASQADSSFCTAFCDASSPCPGGFRCVPVDAATSVCVPDRGGLGAACTSNESCASGICAAQGERTYCTRTCDAVNACPREFVCTLTADGVTSVCEPRETTAPRSSGCRCAAPGARSGAPTSALLLLVGLALAVIARRRR
jgi:hypothetical protein